MNRKYGVIGSRPYRPEPLFKMGSPTTVDHVDRKSLMVPIRDQGDEGSCTGHGWGRALQVALGLDYSLSPQFLYFLGRLALGTQDQDSGAMVGDVGHNALAYGAASEASDPYVAGKFAGRPPFDAFDDAVKIKSRIKFARLFGSNQVKAALAQPNTMVVLGFSVIDYFESADMASTGYLRMPTGTDRFIGGHCVALDGFDARTHEPYFWSPNSWGTGWGPFGGWFKMPFGYIDDSRRLVDEVYAVSPALTASGDAKQDGYVWPAAALPAGRALSNGEQP